MDTKQKGYTLIEFILVMILTGLIMSLTASILGAGLNAYLTTKNLTDADWQARVALSRMALDLRSVALLSSQGPSSFSFTSNTHTTVSYQQSGSTLFRNSQSLADGVSALTLTYFTKNGTLSADVSTTRMIRVLLHITKNHSNYSFTTAIYLRDLA